MPATHLPENSQFGKSIYEGFFTFMDKAASSLALFVLYALNTVALLVQIYRARPKKGILGKGSTGPGDVCNRI